MSDPKEVLVPVPDIGDFDAVPVIEILVGVGDRVRKEDLLVTLESDKTTMDIPSPAAGVVREIAVAVGDRVSQGSPLLHLMEEVDDDSKPSATPPTSPPSSETASPSPEGADDSPLETEPESLSASPDESMPMTSDPTTSAGGSESPALVEVFIPNIGEFSDVPVIDVLVRVGDEIAIEDPLITLESDKSAMDIPSTVAGTIAEIAVQSGDRVSEGALVATVESLAPSATPGGERAQAGAVDPSPAADSNASIDPKPPASSAPVSTPTLDDPRAPRGSPTASLAPEPERTHPLSHATPAMRRFARELGVDLLAVKGTGRKGRILREDINIFVKDALAKTSASSPPAVGLAPIPEVDFAKFGEIETRPLARIKRISGPHLHRSWVNVPHVTSHEEADITELEAFRQSIKTEAKAQGIRITLLAFITHAVARALKEYPNFNASLGPGGDTLVLKKYVHIGIAVDTPGGLMVPVLRDADRKGIYEIAKEMASLGERAREGALKPDEMRGGTFSISSLGGIGGTAFTPIINAPEAAILGLSRTRMRPIWDGEAFRPRLMLPLDLSWDHRIVDGAEAARFLAHLSASLNDVRRLLL
ncbi:dihydrolipoyllysine-residue acetyltransferase [Thioalkalivibrio sp. HK1]|uniref:dihydrolipoyllysine-residue acetyltransferase n=1 Tax=Thioalkalivibrio sp. HK1 TaxID=1469245 RepID=UPI000470160E|nr:dihydrolipoyllysine-residue acetyltransferase [Thioalkalivibrio sp. HK1]